MYILFIYIILFWCKNVFFKIEFLVSNVDGFFLSFSILLPFVLLTNSIQKYIHKLDGIKENII